MIRVSLWEAYDEIPKLTDDIKKRAVKEAQSALRANLDSADEGANLTDAQVDADQLDDAKSLAGAILPDGTQHE